MCIYILAAKLYVGTSFYVLELEVCVWRGNYRMGLTGVVAIRWALFVCWVEGMDRGRLERL
jgi:hypothetical protein